MSDYTPEEVQRAQLLVKDAIEACEYDAAYLVRLTLSAIPRVPDGFELCKVLTAEEVAEWADECAGDAGKRLKSAEGKQQHLRDKHGRGSK